MEVVSRMKVNQTAETFPIHHLSDTLHDLTIIADSIEVKPINTDVLYEPS
jgi:hypothetical protein